MENYKITQSEIDSNNVKSAADLLNNDAQSNKNVFDKLPELIARKVNAFIEAMIAKFKEYYTKTEIDDKEGSLKKSIGEKANAADVYKKSEVYTKTETNEKTTELENAINKKANNEDVYKKEETYTKAEVNQAIGDKIVAIGGGDMAQSVYDVDQNGVVDNSERLGGQSPEYYAVKEETNTAIEKAQSTADTAKTNAETAQSTADTAKSTADTAKSTADTHIANKSNPHGVTASQVGLGNVTNNKQMPIAGGTFTGNAIAYSTNRNSDCLRNITVTNSGGTAQSTNRIIMYRK